MTNLIDTIAEIDTIEESDMIRRGPHGLRVHVPIHLRWGDMDALGHVNNATMLRLIEEARLRAYGRPRDGADAPFTGVMGAGTANEATSMAVVAQQQIEYLTPVPYGRLPLEVQTWMGRLGGSSIEICYEILSPADDAAGPQITYARASGVMVMLDPETQRPRKLTNIERAAWEPILGDPITFGGRR